MINENPAPITMQERDYAVILLPSIEYELQLYAIADLLRRHSEEDERMRISIEEIEEVIRNRKDCPWWIEDDRVDLLNRSVYQNAAHSMAAVGMLAPLVESIFFQVFSEIGNHYKNDFSIFNNSLRNNLNEKLRWDCHYISDKSKNLTGGIIELSNISKLNLYLPNDIETLLKALFEYRNKMFHNGFEWPSSERERFQKRITENKWEKLFSSSKINNSPWIFYMTEFFVSRCISAINEVINKLGAFAIQELPSKQ